MKGYREYDLSTEKIKVGTDKIDPDGNYIVLAKHRPIMTNGSPDTAVTPLFSYTRPCFAPYDPTRYEEVSPSILTNELSFFKGRKLGKEFIMRIEEDCQDLPFEVVFERKSKSMFFDLDELPADRVPQDQ